MAENNSKPEEKKTTANPSETVVAPGEADKKSPDKELPKTKEDQTFAESVEAKTKAYVEKVKSLRKRIEPSGSIGKGKADLIIDRAESRLNAARDAKIDEFRKLMADQKSARMAEMMGQTEQDLSKIYFPYEKIVDYCRGLDKVDDAELNRLEALMEALSKMKTNPEMEGMFMKIINKQPLQPDDYKKIAIFLNPAEISKETGDGKADKLFESAQAGSLVAVMDDAQRMQLIKVMLEVKSPADNALLLDQFMTAGVISQAQVLALCNQGKIPEPQKTELTNKINGGDVAKKQKDYQQKLDRMTTLNEGRTAENPLSKSVGMPGVFAISSLWGAAVALVNMQANWNWKDIPGSISDTLTNPYFVAGVAATGVGMYGMAKIIDPKAAAQAKSDLLDSKAEKQAKSNESKLKLKEAMELPLKTNPYIAKFLTTVDVMDGSNKKSGFTVLREIAQAMRTDGKPARFKYTEILAKAGPEQQKVLKQALGAESSTEFNLEDKLNSFMACCFNEGYITDDKLKIYLDDFNKRQGITA